MWFCGECHVPAALSPGKIPGTCCIGGWLVPRAGLYGYGKSRAHRDSIPGHKYVCSLSQYNGHSSVWEDGTGPSVIPQVGEKVKCTLVQALRLCIGLRTHKGRITLLFLDHGTRGW